MANDATTASFCSLTRISTCHEGGRKIPNSASPAREHRWHQDVFYIPSISNEEPGACSFTHPPPTGKMCFKTGSKPPPPPPLNQPLKKSGNTRFSDDKGSPGCAKEFTQLFPGHPQPEHRLDARIAGSEVWPQICKELRPLIRIHLFAKKDKRANDHTIYIRQYNKAIKAKRMADCYVQCRYGVHLNILSNYNFPNRLEDWFRKPRASYTSEWQEPILCAQPCGGATGAAT